MYAFPFWRKGLAPGANGSVSGRVWVLSGEKVEPRDLKLGRTDGRSTEVLGGRLMPGERVVTDLFDASRASRANGG